MKIKIGKLFEALDKIGMKKGMFEIKDEFGNYTECINYTTKEDTIIKCEMENDEIIIAGSLHKVSEFGNILYLKDCDYIDNISGNTYKILNKTILRNDNVYDIEVNSETHLYSTPGGAIHHNTELSSHLEDVMDIIDVEVKDSELYKYLKSKDSNKEANDVIGFDITTRVINIFRELINKLESDEDTFGEPISGGSKKWYWQWEGNVIYVSPRELDDMISGSIGQGIAELVDFNDYDRSKNYTDDEYLEFQDIIKNNIIDKTCELLSFIGEDKHNIDRPGMQYLYDYIKYQIEMEDFDEIMDVQSQNIVSIKSMVEESDYDFDGMLEYDEMGDVIASYVESVEPEEVTANVSDVIDVIVNDYADTPTMFIDNIIGFYKVMSTCDWNEYSGKISANLTQAFLQRGLKSYAKALLKSAITSNRSYTPEIDGHKYFSILEDLAGRKNYFK